LLVLELRTSFYNHALPIGLVFYSLAPTLLPRVQRYV